MSTDLTAVMKVADRPPVVMVEGHGSWLQDEDGKTYLDFVQGWAVNSVGRLVDLDVEVDAAAGQASTDPGGAAAEQAGCAQLVDVEVDRGPATAGLRIGEDVEHGFGQRRDHRCRRPLPHAGNRPRSPRRCRRPSG